MSKQRTEMKHRTSHFITLTVENAFKEAAKDDVHKKERVDKWFNTKLESSMKLFEMAEENT